MLKFSLLLFLAVFPLVEGPPVRAADTIPLAGEWRFHRDEAKVGEAARWFSGLLPAPRVEPAEIHLPGSTDEARAGLPNPNPPTLDRLYRPNAYAGAAWYQREIDIPEEWKGKQLALFLERVHWVSRVWMDDQYIGTQDSLCVPHMYDLGTGLAPGKHRLTLCIDNTLKYDLGPFVSAYNEGTQTNWNGVVGRMEVIASPAVSISDVEVYPDIERKTAAVKVTVNNTTEAAFTGTLDLAATDRQDGTREGARSLPFKAEPGVSTVSTDLPLSAGVRMWDEFSPALQALTARIAPGGSSKEVTFGMRKLATAGTQFTMNNRPLFLRGTLECCIFPLTGYPPTEVGPWLRICRIVKSYGLNYIRFHSWCPPEAAFTAADEEGIMVQVEGPITSLSAGLVPARDEFIRAELKRIVDVYGNHPSFCLLTLGNEYGGDIQILTEWVDMLRTEDPRHLYSSATNGTPIPDRQFTIDGQGRGIHGPGTMSDARDFVARDPVPHLGHEIGQWTFYPDFNEIPKYTGVLQARNFELVREQLKKKGMLDLAPKIFQTAGRQAILLYKEEIENLRRTPGYAGFALLDLHDYPGQGTALVGPLNAFWESKGFITPAKYREFAGNTAPLLRLPKRTYKIGETLDAEAEVSHFGPSDLRDAEPEWRLEDEKGRVVAGGALPRLDIPTGKLTELGKITVALKGIAAPAKLTISVSLKGTKFRNSWDIWVYPGGPPPVPPPGVLIADDWTDAVKAALSEGRKVIVFPTSTNMTMTLKGSFLPVFWSPIWFHRPPDTMSILCDPRSPALAQFPTEFYSDWQWWDLLNDSISLNLDATPANYRPIIQVTDNFSRQWKLGNLFEARVGKGRLLVCTMDLRKDIADRPAAAQLLRSIYAYVGSDAFNPPSELTIPVLDLILNESSRLEEMEAKVISCDSEAPGYPASNAVDGNANSFWHTAWDPKPAPMPHYIVIDMGKSVVVKGALYLARQDLARGRVKDCEVYVSDSASQWGSPAATATLSNTDGQQRIVFQKPVEGRYVKFMINSSFGEGTLAAVAEFDIIEAPGYPTKN